jgi:oxygen-independent coproporphyrinogen-3 oxidase
MLHAARLDVVEGVRRATPDSLEAFLTGTGLRPTVVSRQAALEEDFFLGLRLNAGVDLQRLEEEFGKEAVCVHAPAIADLCETNLLQQQGRQLSLTPQGRLLSNEVFQRFITLPVEDCAIQS